MEIHRLDQIDATNGARKYRDKKQRTVKQPGGTADVHNT